MKGIYKGFKYITHIFVVKEEEIQIGLPTDVKHVAHIGIDGPSGSAPSWMNDFKAAPEYSSSLCSSPISESAKSTTRDHASSLPPQEGASERDVVASDIPKVRRKQKRKKTTSKSSSSVSSPKASSSPSHVSRPRKSKLKKNSHDGSGDQNLLSIN